MENDTGEGIRPGIYSVDYFSGSQVGIFVGDIFVDEITAINFVAQQNRRPLYGYGDKHFRAMARGQVLVQGQFAINFKEAGYLWLILNHYKKVIKGEADKLNPRNPFGSSSQAFQQNIEDMTDNSNLSVEQRYSGIQSLASIYAHASLTGFSSVQRAVGYDYTDNTKTNLGAAENAFEAFEDRIWGPEESKLIDENRSPDDEDLNPFDIYIMYGDFQRDNRANHTIVKLQDVYIVGSAQRIEADPLPVQEIYSFLARARI